MLSHDRRNLGRKGNPVVAKASCCLWQPIYYSRVPKKVKLFLTSAMIIGGLAEWRYNYKKENQGDGEIEEGGDSYGLFQL